MNLTKPTIFLSHSSRDEDSLVRLKAALTKKTGDTLDIFLSTDGQSIQLGRNWVHKVEDALNRAKISFIFLSPNSLQSKWLFFESGFSYSKGIRVIPVAINGVDLQEVPPPLSLLQGFNIRNHEGLNNILEIINEEFDFSFTDFFTPADYTAIFHTNDILSESGFGAFTQLIRSLIFNLQLKDSSQTLNTVRNRLQQANVQFQEDRHAIHSYGITFRSNEEDKLSINADPSLVGVTFPIIQDICNDLHAIKDNQYVFRLDFEPGIGRIKEHYKTTSKAFGAGISLASEQAFKFGNLIFNLDEYYSSSSYPERIYINLTLTQTKLDHVPVFDLIKLLFEHEILFTINYQ